LRVSFQKSIAQCSKLAELIFFPSLCELCSRLLEHPDEKVVCRTCLQGIKQRGKNYCLCCGRFFDVSSEPHFCARCVKQPPSFSIHRSCGRYEDKLKDFIILYKYRKFRILGTLLAEFAFKTLGKDEDLWWNVEAVIPVPLHPVKEKRRGFNQARLIARRLADYKNVELMEGYLLKIKNTPPQTSLEANERLKNLKRAFCVRGAEKLEGKVVLLVDDVFTTGSTLQECSSELRKAGVKEVRALTLAQA